MAGTPKKRAAREAAAVESVQQTIATPRAPMREALPSPEQPASPEAQAHARAHDARAHAPARARHATRRAMAPGPSMRATADAVQARNVVGLAEALGAATVVRIERLQPRWCAGWVDDFAIEGTDLGELLQYLRDEWGGQSYLCSALDVSGAVIFDAKIPIAGMPKDCGRVIDRDAWEGRAPTAAQPTQATQQPTQAAPSDTLGLVLGILKDANRAQFEAVKEMRAADSKQMAELIQSINRRTEAGNAPRAPSFAEQVGEVVNATRALSKMREAIAVEAPEPKQAPNVEEPDVLKEAMRAGVSQMFAGAFNNQAAAAHGQQHAQPTNGRSKRPMREAPSEGVPPRPKAQA